MAFPAVSSYKRILSKKPKKLARIWANMKENLLQKELSKIAQSGHSTVVAQLIEQVLPKPEIRGLNPIIGNFYLLLIV